MPFEWQEFNEDFSNRSYHSISSRIVGVWQSMSDVIRMEFVFSSQSINNDSRIIQSDQEEHSADSNDNVQRIDMEFFEHKRKLDQNIQQIQELQTEIDGLKGKLDRIITRVRAWNDASSVEKEFPVAKYAHEDYCNDDLHLQINSPLQSVSRSIQCDFEVDQQNSADSSSFGREIRKIQIANDYMRRAISNIVKSPRNEKSNDFSGSGESEIEELLSARSMLSIRSCTSAHSALSRRSDVTIRDDSSVWSVKSIIDEDSVRPDGSSQACGGVDSDEIDMSPRSAVPRPPMSPGPPNNTRLYIKPESSNSAKSAGLIADLSSRSDVRSKSPSMIYKSSTRSITADLCCESPTNSVPAGTRSDTRLQSSMSTNTKPNANLDAEKDSDTNAEADEEVYAIINTTIINISASSSKTTISSGRRCESSRSIKSSINIEIETATNAQSNSSEEPATSKKSTITCQQLERDNQSPSGYEPTIRTTSTTSLYVDNDGERVDNNNEATDKVPSARATFVNEPNELITESDAQITKNEYKHQQQQQQQPLGAIEEETTNANSSSSRSSILNSSRNNNEDLVRLCRSIITEHSINGLSDAEISFLSQRLPCERTSKSIDLDLFTAQRNKYAKLRAYHQRRIKQLNDEIIKSEQLVEKSLKCWKN